jgi:hypothetical protein
VTVVVTAVVVAGLSRFRLTRAWVSAVAAFTVLLEAVTDARATHTTCASSSCNVPSPPTPPVAGLVVVDLSFLLLFCCVALLLAVLYVAAISTVVDVAARL